MSIQRVNRIGVAGRGALGIGMLSMLLLAGCVSSGKYETLVSERDQLADQRARLAEERTQLAKERDLLAEEQQRLSSKVEQTEQQKQAAARQAAEAQAELQRQQQVYDKLQATFAKEQQANQVKIEMLKSGVKVNLANDILFPSGSAALNQSGVEMLTRAAAELKSSPYQTLVAGFTDNVAISGKLMDKYPSNWELAAARAASVVRLLEREGVASEQLLAVSFGENSPVADNGSAEGRSKNRRIEIILRPVAVTLD